MSQILEVADICCQGRVISVLEGGYGRTPPEGTQNSSINPQKGSNHLDKEVFSECAIRHLDAMIDPYNLEMQYPSSGCGDIV